MAAKAKHQFTTCHDDDCPRIPCIAYKIGYEIGFEEGYAAGSQAGQATSE